MTDRGLQLTQGEGEDILTISRYQTPTFGDALSFHLRTSAIRQKGFGSEAYSVFDVEGTDNIADFAYYLPKLKLGEEPKPEIPDFPEEAQVFEEYTFDEFKHVGCVALDQSVVEARNSRDKETTELLQRAEQVIAVASTVLRIAEEDRERVDVRAFGYPLGIRPGFTPIMLAEHANDNLRLYFDQNNRSMVPMTSALKLAQWVEQSRSSLKKKSIW